MHIAAKFGKALAGPVITIAKSKQKIIGKIFLGLLGISVVAIGRFATKIQDDLDENTKCSDYLTASKVFVNSQSNANIRLYISGFQNSIKS